MLRGDRHIYPSQIQRQDQQADVRSNTQRGQYDHCIPTRPKLPPIQPVLPDFRKELLVPLLSPKHAYYHHPHPVDREECPDAVEFRSENFEHDQCKGEL